MRSPSSRPSPLLALPLLALLIACGSPVAPELSLTGPSSAAVIRGDSSSIDLTLARNETAIDEVTLSVEGLPEGVTATFEPATLAGDALATTLHLEAAREAAGASVLVTVRATGPEALVAAHAFALNVGGLTVEGSVETQSGEPLTRPLTVKVGTQWVATDAQGHFVAHQVSVPYDLVLKGDMLTEIYTGLRTATPVVRGFIDMMSSGVSESMSVNGTITPVPTAGERVTVCASAVRPELSDCDTIIGDGSHNTYSIYIPLAGGPSEHRQVVARREVLDGDGRSVGFTGHAEAVIPYAPDTHQVLDLVLASSSSTPISFSLDSAGHAPLIRNGLVSYGAFLNAAESLPPDVFHLPEGAQGAIIAAVGNEATGGSVTIQPVTGPLEGPISFATLVPMISPSEDATLNEDVTFSVADPAGALVSHTFIVDGGGLMFLHTFDAQLPFAELAAHADGLLPADIQGWVVVTTPNITSTEQALGEPVGYLSLIQTVNGAIDPAILTEPLQLTIAGPRMFAAPVIPAMTHSPLFGRLPADLFR